MKRTIYSVLIAAVLVVVSACAPAPDELWSLQGKTMGTTYHVKLLPGDLELEQQVLQQQIDAALVQVNKEMSTYDPTSELSRFNQLPAETPMLVSDGTAKVVAESLRLGEMTGGVLDVTVGPLVNLWGFGPQARPETVPDEEEIAATKARTGLQYLQLNGNTLNKSHDDLYVDLSTIAKGYGVDVVAELLEQHGITDYLVEVGGEMRLKGNKGNAGEWRVAIEKPVTTERAVQQIISVGDNAVATSGDYRNYFEENGVRYSHLIDPHTGKPITHNLVSVTVVHPSSMTADGLATAINVMGFEKGKAFAEQHDLNILMIARQNEGFVTYYTKGFDAFLR